MTDPSSDRTISLIGFRASGKSALGARLAEELARPFFDLDAEIEMALGRSIRDLFAEEGEAWFREVEAEFLEGILMRPSIVLAPGGGAVLRAANRELLADRSTVIYLCPSEADLLARLRLSRERPALTSLPLAEEVRTVLSKRQPLYRETADKTLAIPPGEPEEETFQRLRRALGLS